MPTPEQRAGRRRFLKVSATAAAAAVIYPLVEGCTGPDTKLNIPTTPNYTIDGNQLFVSPDFSKINYPDLKSHFQTVNSLIDIVKKNPDLLIQQEKGAKFDGVPEASTGVSIDTVTSGEKPFSVVSLPRVKNPNATNLEENGQHALLVVKGEDVAYFPVESASTNEKSVEIHFDPQKGDVFQTTITELNMGEYDNRAKSTLEIKRWDWNEGGFKPIKLPVSNKVLDDCARLENLDFNGGIETKDLDKDIKDVVDGVDLPKTLTRRAYLAAMETAAGHSLGHRVKDDKNPNLVIVPNITDSGDDKKKVSTFVKSLDNSLVDIPKPQLVMIYVDTIHTKTKVKQGDKDVEVDEVSARQRIETIDNDGNKVIYEKNKFEPNNSYGIVALDAVEIDPPEGIKTMQEHGLDPYTDDFTPPSVFNKNSRFPEGNIIKMQTVNPGCFLDAQSGDLQLAVRYHEIAAYHPNHKQPLAVEAGKNAPESIQDSTASNILSPGNKMNITVAYARQNKFPVGRAWNDVTPQFREAYQRGVKVFSRFGMLSPDQDFKRLVGGFPNVEDPTINALTNTDRQTLMTGQDVKHKNWAVVVADSVDVNYIDTRKQPDISPTGITLKKGECFPMDPNAITVNLLDSQGQVYLINPYKIETTFTNREEIGAGISDGDVNGIQFVEGDFWGRPDKNIAGMAQTSHNVLPRGVRTRILGKVLDLASN